jgi:hypothetical protein
MLNPAHSENDPQIEAAWKKSAALIVAPRTTEFPDPPVDMQTGEDQPKEPKRKTSFLGGILRFAGATVGFLMGGPAGAALGSVVGELAGDMAAERTRIIWPMLGYTFLYPKGAHHEEDACDPGSRHTRRP